MAVFGFALSVIVLEILSICWQNDPYVEKISICPQNQQYLKKYNSWDKSERGNRKPVGSSKDRSSSRSESITSKAPVGFNKKTVFRENVYHA